MGRTQPARAGSRGLPGTLRPIGEEYGVCAVSEPTLPLRWGETGKGAGAVGAMLRNLGFICRH